MYSTIISVLFFRDVYLSFYYYVLVNNLCS